MSSTDFKTLTYETDGRVATITLNRPERMNAICAGMPTEIAAAVEAALREKLLTHPLRSGGACAVGDDTE